MRDEKFEQDSFETLDKNGHLLSKDSEKFIAEKNRRRNRYNSKKRIKHDKWDNFN